MKKVIGAISIVGIMIFVLSTAIFAANIPVTGIKTEKTYITLEIGQTEKVNVTFSPMNASNKGVNWSSSNSNVARVNAKGEVKGMSGGIATIKGITLDGGYTVNVTVNVSGESSVKTDKYLLTKKENSLKEEIRYISKIAPKTDVRTFKSNISTYANMEFYGLTGSRLADMDYISTGSILKLSDRSEYTLIISGDVNSDGKISASDLSRLKIKLVGLSTLDDCQMEAADVNFDNNVTMSDLATLKMYIVGLVSEF